MEGETFAWLVRHAIVDGIAGTIHASDAPADLSDRPQLDALQQQLLRNARSYASPARRTVDTARALGLDPVPVPEFREQDFGDWTGRRHDDLAAAGGDGYKNSGAIRPAHNRRAAKALRTRSPGFGAASTRSQQVRRTSWSIPAPFCAALCIALDLTPEAALRFVINPLSLTRIDRLSNGWRVVSVNQRVA